MPDVEKTGDSTFKVTDTIPEKQVVTEYNYDNLKNQIGLIDARMSRLQADRDTLQAILDQAATLGVASMLNRIKP